MKPKNFLTKKNKELMEEVLVLHAFAGLWTLGE